MSSYANGCMIVVLPEEYIGTFEDYFDQDNNNSFLNTEITLVDCDNVYKYGYQKRIYDISCNTSLEACLVESRYKNKSRYKNIRDICKNLNIIFLNIDACNSEENFNEAISYDIRDGACRYYSDSEIEGRVTYKLLNKTELVAG